MKENGFVYVNRQWLKKVAKLRKPKIMADFIRAIHGYAFKEEIPALPRKVQEYFDRVICPAIDEQRTEWRQYDRRRAQFTAIIGHLPDKIRQRYELDFMTNVYADEADFLAYLDEVREGLNNSTDNER